MGSLVTGLGVPHLAQVFTLPSTMAYVDLCSVTVGLLVVGLTCLSLSILVLGFYPPTPTLCPRSLEPAS